MSLADPPLPPGLTDRLTRLSNLVPANTLPADELARLRGQVRNWQRRLEKIEAEAKVLWDDYRGTAELIDEALDKIERLKR